MGRYFVGEKSRLTGTFAILGTPTDPAGGVTLRVTDPEGTETQPTPTNPSVGTYTADVLLDKEGLWHYRFEGDPEGAGEGKLEVRSDFS